MAIAFKAAGAATEETGTSHEIAPPTLADGDLMIAAAATIAGTADTLTLDETGWTEIGSQSGTTGTDVIVTAWWKIAASESGNYTITHAGSETFKGFIFTYTGVDATTPMDATATTAGHTVNSATHTPADITTVTDQAWVISILAKGGGSVDGTAPSGYVERIAAATGGGPFLAAADTDGGQSTGVQSPPDWTDLGSAAESDSITIALRPASDASPVVVFENYYRHLLGGESNF